MVDEIQDNKFKVNDKLFVLEEFKNDYENKTVENESKLNNLMEKNQELSQLNENLKIKLRFLKDNLYKLCSKLCNDKFNRCCDIKNDLETLDI